MMNTKIAHTGMINNNRTNRQKIKASATTSGSLSAVNGTTAVITSNRRISLATEGLKPYVENWLKIKTSNKNALTISEYVLLLRREINPSQNYTKTQIQALVELSEYLKQKPFEQLINQSSSYLILVFVNISSISCSYYR